MPGFATAASSAAAARKIPVILLMNPYIDSPVCLQKKHHIGGEVEIEVTQDLPRRSRLFVLSVLLDHALAESRALSLPQVDELLGAAARTVAAELDREKALSPKTDTPQRDPPAK